MAEQNEIAAIAFPTISTGAFGYPMEPAARITLKTLIDMLPRLSSVKHVRLALFRLADIQVHEGVLENVIGENVVE